MFKSLKKFLRSDDRAVSAVIGTILMIAATVILGGAIYAATNGFGEKDTAPKEDLLFKAQGIDTDADQMVDAIKLTYLAGPKLAELDITIVRADGATFTAYYTGKATGLTLPETDWEAGQFIVVREASGSSSVTLDDGSYIVTVSFNGNTVLDTMVVVG